jgi:hypothetical protein
MRIRSWTPFLRLPQIIPGKSPQTVPPPKPRSKAPNPPPAPTRTARERAKFLFTQNLDYFSPSPSLGGDEEGDLDPYAGLTSIPLMPTNVRTISASTKASGSGSSRSNSTGSASSVGAIVRRVGLLMEDDEVESFEDVFADTYTCCYKQTTQTSPQGTRKYDVQWKPFRFVLPESPIPEPDPESRAPSKAKGKGKERARSASSRSSTATAEDTDEGEEGGVRKSSRRSRALDSPCAGERVGLLRLGARELLAPPARKGWNKTVDLIELSDSEEGEPRATSASRTKNTNGVSKIKPNVADVSVIDLDSD